MFQRIKHYLNKRRKVIAAAISIPATAYVCNKIGIDPASEEGVLINGAVTAIVVDLISNVAPNGQVIVQE